MDERQPFQQLLLGNKISAYRRLKLDAWVSLHTKVNSKCIEDLNIRHGTLKQSQEGVGNTLE
jgi:hypothetical protein